MITFGAIIIKTLKEKHYNKREFHYPFKYLLACVISLSLALVCEEKTGIKLPCNPNSVF